MAEHKTFIRKIKQGNATRYAEVWNERKGKDIIQHHVRYLGSDPDNLPPPSSFDIEKVHFGYLAQLILSDALSAEDVYLMLEGMGKSVERRDIQSIILRHNLDRKKTRLRLVFPRKKDNIAQSAGED
jgi:hypothetical protein